MELLITDVTRFHSDNICLAGVDVKTGSCVRPRPYFTREEAATLRIAPGRILACHDVTPHPHVRAPHVEDMEVGVRQLFNCQNRLDFRRVLDDSVVPGVVDGFGGEPVGKCFPLERTPNRSIITLKVEGDAMCFQSNPHRPKSMSLSFRDQTGRSWDWVSVTDLVMHHSLERSEPYSFFKRVNMFFKSAASVYLRIGLTRPFAVNGQNGCWIQVNGAYAFHESGVIAVRLRGCKNVQNIPGKC